MKIRPRKLVADPDTFNADVRVVPAGPLKGGRKSKGGAGKITAIKRRAAAADAEAIAAGFDPAKPAPNPLRVDPTRLGKERARMVARLNARFAELARIIEREIGEDDAFGTELEKHFDAGSPSITNAAAPGFPLSLQESDWDCGPAVLRAACRWVGKECPDFVEASREHGTNPLAMVEALKAAGIDARLGHFGSPLDLECPALCLIQHEEPARYGNGHWVAVLEVAHGMVRLMDPAKGFRWLPVRRFDERWHDRDSAGRDWIRCGVEVRRAEPIINVTHLPPYDPDKPNGGWPTAADKAAEDAHPSPTSAQREAGNYVKGHVRVAGLDVTIETAKGSKRKPWHDKVLGAHYGYLKRTEGNDGDHVDVFLGPDPESDKVFVIDQNKADGSFDEHKALLGFPDAASAKTAYLAGYPDDWAGFGGMRELSVEDFRIWLAEGDMSKPVAEWPDPNAEGAKLVERLLADFEAVHNCGGKGGTMGPCPEGHDFTRAAKVRAAVAFWQAKAGGQLGAFIDSIPGGKWVRGKLAARMEWARKRYGEKTMKRIVAAATVTSWTLAIGGAAHGVVIYAPIMGLTAVGAALAELHLRAKQAMGRVEGLTKNVEDAAGHEHDERGKFTSGGKLKGESLKAVEDVARQLTEEMDQHPKLNTVHHRVEEYQNGTFTKIESRMDALARGKEDQYSYDLEAHKFGVEGIGELARQHFEPLRAKLRELVGDHVTLYRGADETGGIPGKKLSSYAAEEKVASRFLEGYDVRGNQEKKVLKAIQVPVDAVYMAVRTPDRPLEFFIDNDKLPRHLAANTRFAFHSSSEQVKAFQRWLQIQLARLILSADEDEAWRRYAEEGYRKGAGRAFDDMGAARVGQRGAVSDFSRGSRADFLRSSFGQPVSVERIKVLAGRTFDEMRNVTHDMATKMSRVLTDGLVQGKHSREVAKDLVREVGLGRYRARLVAQTELTRAHAHGQLDSFKAQGMDRVGVQAEFATARDNVVCPACAALEGQVFDVADAYAEIPQHPLCRCAWKPAIGKAMSMLRRAVANRRLYPWPTRPTVANAVEDEARDEKGRWAAGGGGEVDIHDPKTGEWFWTGSEEEGKRLLKEQEEEEPGHGLTLRPAVKSSAARAAEDAAKIAEMDRQGTERRREQERQSKLASPHGYLPGHDKFVDPPERLFHATFAKDVILKEGLKGSDELGSGVLGGSSGQLVSFAGKEDAEFYRDALNVAREAAQGRMGMEDFVRAAVKYGVAERRAKEFADEGEKRGDRWFDALQRVSMESGKFPIFMGGRWSDTVKDAGPASTVSIASKDAKEIWYNPGEREWRVGGLKGVPVANAAEDEPRDEHGKWTTGGDVPTALRPKLADGRYPKSAELHEAAASPAKLEELFKRLPKGERGKLTRLVEMLQAHAKMREKDTETPQNKGVDADEAHAAVKGAVGEFNLAKLTKVRDAMPGLSREQQDAALMELHRQGKIGFSGPEGRTKPPEEERAAWLRVGGELMGHAYLRGPTGNTFCPTGEGGGVDPSCGKGGEADGDAADARERLAAMAGGGDAAGHVKAVLARASEEAVKRLARNLQGIQVHASERALTEEDQRLSQRPLKAGEVTSGFCWPEGDKVTVHLAAGTEAEWARGTAAHELGHALDGPRQFLSRSEEWKEAWHAEVDRKGDPLTSYARIKPAEGFAEYCRLLWTEDEGTAKRFPLCHSFFRQRGLV